MKRIIIAAIIIGSFVACKKSTAPNTESPTKYYFKIEPVSVDGSTTTTTYKETIVN